MSTKKVLITGITGQDGSYLADLLLEKGYEVHGIIRRSSTLITRNIDHIIKDIELHYGDLSTGIEQIILSVKPDEIYNLGSMSHVRISFDIPDYTFNVNASGVLKILECLRQNHLDTKFYQASSSEMFGMSPPPQNENTIFNPCSPYGIAKLAGYWITKTYRESYGIFASNGICFNHESPRRGENFVTKKIIRAAVKIKLKKQKILTLGNLDAKRDWGFAGDYVKAMYLILQHTVPDDFVIATEESFTVLQFLDLVFKKLDLDYQQFVQFDNRYKRPKEVPSLMGDASKIRKVLNWEPETDINQLIDLMIEQIMREEC